MNINVTTKEEILRTSRAIVAENGISGLNMRKVAEACGVALGSLYNYFSSKDELMTATVESVWKDIFFEFQLERLQAVPFPEYVKKLYQSAKVGSVLYPRFFAEHSIIFTGAARSNARALMESCFSDLKVGLKHCLSSDPSVSAAAFTDEFRVDTFIDFVFSFLIYSLGQNKDIDFLVEVIRRTIY